MEDYIRKTSSHLAKQLTRFRDWRIEHGRGRLSFTSTSFRFLQCRHLQKKISKTNIYDYLYVKHFLYGHINTLNLDVPFILWSVPLPTSDLLSICRSEGCVDLGRAS